MNIQILFHQTHLYSPDAETSENRNRIYKTKFIIKDVPDDTALWIMQGSGIYGEKDLERKGMNKNSYFKIYRLIFIQYGYDEPSKDYINDEFDWKYCFGYTANAVYDDVPVQNANKSHLKVVEFEGSMKIFEPVY